MNIPALISRSNEGIMSCSTQHPMNCADTGSISVNKKESVDHHESEGSSNNSAIATCHSCCSSRTRLPSCKDIVRRTLPYKSGQSVDHNSGAKRMNGYRSRERHLLGQLEAMLHEKGFLTLERQINNGNKRIAKRKFSRECILMACVKYVKSSVALAEVIYGLMEQLQQDPHRTCTLEEFVETCLRDLTGRAQSAEGGWLSESMSDDEEGEGNIKVNGDSELWFDTPNFGSSDIKPTKP